MIKVNIDDAFMGVAYQTAKVLYGIKEFNKIPLPVAVIVKDFKVISIAASGHGIHQAEGECARQGYKTGQGYFACDHCNYEEHAEILALRSVNVTGFDIYIYGHYYVCEMCLTALKEKGVKDIYILENAEVLFDIENPKCVIGKPKQFAK